MLPVWASLADKFHDPNRVNYVRETLSLSAGVYRDKQKSKQLGIPKTVLINVVEYQNKESATKYKKYLANWFCYTQHYSYEPVVFILHDENATGTSFEQIRNEFVALDNSIRILSYPFELFWRLLSHKKDDLSIKWVRFFCVYTERFIIK